MIAVARYAGVCLFACVLGVGWSLSVAAAPKVRIYEINKKEQQRQIVIGSAVENPGCHNLLWGKKVYRFAQFGFAWCSLYAKDDCAPDSIVPAVWSSGNYHKYNIKAGTLQEKLYPGEKWLIQADGKAVQSWYCEAQ